MFQFDPTTGSMVLPIWVSATLAAVLVVLAVLAIARSGTIKTVAIVLGTAVLVYAGWAGSLLLDRAGANDRVDERRVFEQRTGELIGRAMVPGSPLACLDTAGGEQVDGACEKVLFSSPENIAAAVSFTTARMVLLADGLDIASRSDLNYDAALGTLRRGLEADRYGMVAHVLLQRESCTPDQCEALGLLNDPNRVRANLQDKPFEALVARYAPNWPTPGQAASPMAEAPRAPGRGTGVPMSSKFDFPSSSSIPPVSIMSAEPSTPPAAASAAAAPSTTGTAPTPLAPPAAAATAPPTTAAATQTPPVPPRRPPAARAPAAHAPAARAPSAPAAATAASASSPVQLTPSAPPQGQQTQ